MPEWLNGAVSKTVVRHWRTEGSNPSPSVSVCDQAAPRGRSPVTSCLGVREHRGVYRVGHRAPSVEARYLAAVLACGRGAVLSGRAAAHLLGLLKGRPPRAEVTTRTERRVPRVVTRRARGAEGRDAIAWCGIPVTTVATTLVDIAAVVDGRREREARRRGDEFRPYTHDDVFEDPRTVLAELGPLLSSGPA